jgi:hypothetical protein
METTLAGRIFRVLFSSFADGRLMAYMSSEAERPRVYVCALPNMNKGSFNLRDIVTFSAIDSLCISPVDRLFLLIEPVRPTDEEPTTESSRKIVAATNWFEELKERVPVDQKSKLA